MKVDIKDIIELLLLNYKVEVEYNKNIDEVEGYHSCIESLTQLPMLNDWKEIEYYRDLLKTTK